MAEVTGSSSAPANNNKPVIVRVKRKALQSPLDAFWLEISGRPLKRPLIDFEKLSISQSSSKVVEVKTKKVLVQHIKTISNSDVNVDVLRSFLPDAVSDKEVVPKSEERRHSVKSKQDQLLGKAKREHEVLSKSARFEQVWRRRKGTKVENHDEALSEMCQIYDVVRVDVSEKAKEVNKQEDTELEDHMLMSSFLPLLRETIPDAASEIESEINDHISKRASKDDYVYDLYVVNDDTTMALEDGSNPFPLVQVDEDDDFYDGPDESENESYDSNAEDNPINEYPDEETSSNEEETQSRTSDDISDEKSVSSAESLEPEEFEGGLLQDDYVEPKERSDDDLFEEEIYDYEDETCENDDSED